MDASKTITIINFIPRDTMDDQKDNQIQTPSNTEKIPTGLSATSSRPNALGGQAFLRGRAEEDIYGFINKKTEKLVTALYMVTDCIDFDDALKVKLRSLGVELLSDMYKFSIFSVVDKHSHINTSISRTTEIISFIDIASTIGFISEMNAGILKREFGGLILELESRLPNKQQFSFVLNEEMFAIPRPLGEIKRTEYKGQAIGQSIGQDKGQKKDNYELRINNYELGKNKERQNPQSKSDRTEKIIFLMKVKGEVSIKDISATFTECSEKTIQRNLTELIATGQVKKTGDKRWSRYSLITN
jgi:hypothetical protein